MLGFQASEVLGQRGVFEFLGELYESQFVDSAKINEVLTNYRVASPETTFDQLTTLSIIFEADRKFYLTPKGRQFWWLLQAINGGDLKETVRQLSQIDPTLLPYEIVTEGMTGEFIQSLYAYPTFRRVFICSPWVHMKRKVLQKLSYAIYKAQERNVNNKIDLIVIARPLNKRDPAYPQFLQTFQILIQLGAEIVVHEKLHAKLYIRDPGPAGGFNQAIFGSENLTSKRNIEIGIRITNDTAMINKLITYFFDLYQECKPFKEDPR